VAKNAIKPKTKIASHNFRSAMMLAELNFHDASDWPPFLQSKEKLKMYT
jgi:hypothetical protein